MACIRSTVFGCFALLFWLPACNQSGVSPADPDVAVGTVTEDLVNCNLNFLFCASQGQPCSAAAGGPACCANQNLACKPGDNCCPPNLLANGQPSGGIKNNCCSGAIGPPPLQNCCANPGQGCAVAADCCTPANPNNHVVCGAELNACCLLANSQCAVASDCCSGICQNFVCVPPHGPPCAACNGCPGNIPFCENNSCTCEPNGFACNGVPGNCCSNNCQPGPNPVCCELPGQVCNHPEDCCTGQCVGPVGQPGNCSCLALGGGCTNSNVCCAGEFCDATSHCACTAHNGNCAANPGDCCNGEVCTNGLCKIPTGSACPSGIDGDCVSGDCDNHVCVLVQTGGLGHACFDPNDCNSEMSCPTGVLNPTCCIQDGSLLNRCTQDSDCCGITVNGVSKTVRCKDSVCQNDLNGACRTGFDGDCAPGNVCVANVCLVEAEAIHCNNSTECESNDCTYPTCACVADGNPATNAVSCCNGNDVNGTCKPNTTRGQGCTGPANCTTQEVCSNGRCRIPYTSREQGTAAADCVDGTWNPATKECCSPTAQTHCTHNEDCCQGLICETDLQVPVCVYVANNPGCNITADCLPGLTCTNHVCH